MGLGSIFCYETPFESGTFQCYERGQPRFMQHPGISDNCLRTANTNSHRLEVIKTSVKCLLFTPCL